MSTYAEHEVDNAPAWMSRPWGRMLNFIFGLTKDAFVEAAKQAVKARFPSEAPFDALERLIADYRLPGRFNETEAQTRARLAAAWSSWADHGRRAGMLAALAAAGYSNVQIHERAVRWFDFVVVLRAPFPFDPATIGYSRWNAGWTWHSGYRWFGVAPAIERDRVLAIIKHWQPGWANLLYVVVGVEGPYWGDFNYGDGTTYGGTAEYWPAT